MSVISRGPSARSLLVSNGLPASEDRAVIRFAARQDSIERRDTLRAYTVDSAQLSLNLVARDTLVNGLKLYLYRIDPTVDEDDTFATVGSAVGPYRDHRQHRRSPTASTRARSRPCFAAPTWRRWPCRWGPGGSWRSGSPWRPISRAGIRLGALATSTEATFISFVTLDVPDTGSAKRESVRRRPSFNAFVTESPQIPDNAFLTVGGEPSVTGAGPLRSPGRHPRLGHDRSGHARVDAAVTDAGTADPIRPLLQAKALLADLGCQVAGHHGGATLRRRHARAGQRRHGTARRDVHRPPVARPRVVRLRPYSSRCSRRPEASPARSSARPGLGPWAAALLRITYLKSFPFENP